MLFVEVAAYSKNNAKHVYALGGKWMAPRMHLRFSV
jgi:hypothetical protein